MEIKLMIVLIFITVSNLGHSKTIKSNTFLCQKKFSKGNSTKQEVHTLKVNYIKELDSKINKDVAVIQNHLNKKVNDSKIEEVLLNFMKKVLCIDDLIGDLDYFEDLYNIKNKFELSSDFKKTYQETFTKLSNVEKERIQKAFESLKDLNKNGDF